MSIGKVNRFFVANGMSELREGGGYNISPASNFDGEPVGELEFSYASGRMRKNRAKRVKRRTADKKTINSNLQDRRNRKTASEQRQAKTIENISKPSKEEAQLVEALTNAKTPVDPKPTMSKGLKIVIVVGSVAVATTIAIIVYKHYKNK